METLAPSLRLHQYVIYYTISCMLSGRLGYNSSPSPKPDPDENEDNEGEVALAPPLARARRDVREERTDYVESTKDCLVKKGFSLKCKPEEVYPSKDETIEVKNIINDIQRDSAGKMFVIKNNNEELIIRFF